MSRFPKDTYQLLRRFNQNLRDVPNLWYSLNYNHYQHRNIPRRRERNKFYLIKNRNVQTIGEKVEHQRLRMLIDGEIPISILQGNVENNILPGFGLEHVHESAISLHHVYGIPYIPSSSVKGVVRRWYIQYFLEGKESHLSDPPEHLQQKAAVGKIMFGCGESKGVAQFFDIFLYDNCSIKPDVMAVHHANYYSQVREPSDQETTIPISFYSVDVRNINIICGISPHGLTKDYSPNLLLNLLTNWVMKALEELGIGAKTTVGYGRFRQIEDVTAKLKQEIETELNKQREKVEQRLLEAKRIEEEKMLKEKLAQMSKEERLVYEISMLSPSEQDQDESKGNLFHKVIEQNNEEAAIQLKKFWQKTGNWKRKEVSKKQLEKVRQIRKFLDECN